MADSHGTLGPDRDDLDEPKRALVEDLGLQAREAGERLLEGADVVVGLAGPAAFSAQDVEAMAEDAIVFALANPEPELDPRAAREAGAAVVATGRSDYPNQVNNVLAFPGVFRGLLDADMSDLDDDAARRAACALADHVGEPSADSILPTVFDERVVTAVAAAVADT